MSELRIFILPDSYPRAQLPTDYREQYKERYDIPSLGDVRNCDLLALSNISSCINKFEVAIPGLHGIGVAGVVNGRYSGEYSNIIFASRKLIEGKGGSAGLNFTHKWGRSCDSLVSGRRYIRITVP